MHNDILIELGHSVQHFGTLESILDALVEDLLGVNKPIIATCVVAELSFRGRAHLIGSLHELRELRTDIRGELRGLMKRAMAIEARRNQLLHSLWGVTGVEDEQVPRLKITAKGRLKGQAENVSIRVLKTFNDSIVDLFLAIEAFRCRENYDFVKEVQRS